MSEKRMLADVLWEAANKWLWSGGCQQSRSVMHSCNALRWASNQRIEPTFLHELGAPNHSGDFPDGDDEQGCRYMFLLLAMHVAEDEGITV
jgi:hypothetical protein